jgi:amino acid transporter
VSPKTGTPVNSIILMCIIFSFFIALDFNSLIDADVTLNMLGLVLEFAALIALRIKFPNMVRPFKVPGGMFGAVAVAVVPTFLAWWLLKSSRVTEPVSFWISIILVAASALAYPLLKKFLKRGRPDGELDLSGVDFGDGIDAEAVLLGEVTRA